jgi:LPS export ABC transporter protein LptC
MKRSRASWHRSVIAGCVLTLLPFGGCKDKPVAGPTPALPNQIIECFTLHESNSGKRLYTLQASRALVYEAEQRVDVTELHVSFYDDNGAVHSTLVADQGTIYSRTEDLVARGNVSVTTEDSTVLLTDSLAWSNAARLVRTDAPLLISTPKGRVKGKGLVSDAGLSKIEIQSEVTGTSDYDFETGK